MVKGSGAKQESFILDDESSKLLRAAAGFF
jgi:hypothetical protein